MTTSGLLNGSGTLLFAVEARQQLAAGAARRAIETCRIGLARHPDHAAGYVIMAAAYSALGEGERARRVLMRGYERTGLEKLRVLADDVARPAAAEAVAPSSGETSPAAATSETPVSITEDLVEETVTTDEPSIETAVAEPPADASAENISTPTPSATESSPESTAAAGSPRGIAPEDVTEIALPDAASTGESAVAESDSAPNPAVEPASVAQDAPETGTSEADSLELATEETAPTGAPAEEPPVEEPPVEEPPVEEPKKDEPPVEDPEKDEPPVKEPPVEQPSIEEPPAPKPAVQDPPVQLAIERQGEERTGGELLPWFQRRTSDRAARPTLALHSGKSAHRLTSSNLRLIPGLEFAPLRAEDPMRRMSIAPIMEDPLPEWEVRRRKIDDAPPLPEYPSPESTTTESARAESARSESIRTESASIAEPEASTVAPAVAPAPRAVETRPATERPARPELITSKSHAPADDGGADTSSLDELARRLEGARIAPIGEAPTAQRHAFEPSIVSDTLAEILVSQGAYGEAIKAFMTLARTRPEKLAYYEERIAEMKQRMRESGE